MRLGLLLIGLALPALALDNGVRIRGLTATGQSGRPITIHRIFKEGEIAEFARPRVNGVAVPDGEWQCDVRQRHRDQAATTAITGVINPTGLTGAGVPWLFITAPGHQAADGEPVTITGVKDASTGLAIAAINRQWTVFDRNPNGFFISLARQAPGYDVTEATVVTKAHGSLKEADISLRVDVPASGGSATVDFVNSSALPYSPMTTRLTRQQMLDFDAGSGAGNWGAAIEATAPAVAGQVTTYTMSAREMLTDWDGVEDQRGVRYWHAGPVVTTAIVEDRSAARRYDFGWEYLTGRTLTGAVVAADRTVSVSSTSGMTAPFVLWMQSSSANREAMRICEVTGPTTLRVCATATDGMEGRGWFGSGTRVFAAGTRVSPMQGKDPSSDVWRVLHPYFILSFYTGHPGVRVEYIVESPWTDGTNSTYYAVRLLGGTALSTVRFATPEPFWQAGWSRWRKTFWEGTDPEFQDKGGPWSTEAGTLTNIVTSGTANGMGVATANFAAPHGLNVGDRFVVSGYRSDIDFNGIRTVASVPTPTSLTYAQGWVANGTYNHPYVAISTRRRTALVDHNTPYLSYSGAVPQFNFELPPTDRNGGYAVLYRAYLGSDQADVGVRRRNYGKEPLNGAIRVPGTANLGVLAEASPDTNHDPTGGSQEESGILLRRTALLLWTYEEEAYDWLFGDTIPGGGGLFAAQGHNRVLIRENSTTRGGAAYTPAEPSATEARAQGRIISVQTGQRATLYYSNLGNSSGGDRPTVPCGNTADWCHIIPAEGSTMPLSMTPGYGLDNAHQPEYFYTAWLLTGGYYELEALQGWGTVHMAYRNPSPGYNPNNSPTAAFAAASGRHADWNYHNAQEDLPRTRTWSLLAHIRAAYASPNVPQFGMATVPERRYFERALTSHFHVEEGAQNIQDGNFPPRNATCSDVTPTDATAGHTIRTTTDKHCWGWMAGGKHMANPFGFHSLGNGGEFDISTGTTQSRFRNLQVDTTFVSGGVATLRTTTPHGLAAGEFTFINDTGSSALNGNKRVTAVLDPRTMQFATTAANGYYSPNVVVAGGVATADLGRTHGLSAGDTVALFSLDSAALTGTRTVTAVPMPTTIQYATTATNGVYGGVPITADGTRATVTTPGPHGRSVGQTVTVDDSDNPALDGARTITSVASTTQFTFTTNAQAGEWAGGEFIQHFMGNMRTSYQEAYGDAVLGWMRDAGFTVQEPVRRKWARLALNTLQNRLGNPFTVALYVAPSRQFDRNGQWDAVNANGQAQANPLFDSWADLMTAIDPEEANANDWLTINAYSTGVGSGYAHYRLGGTSFAADVADATQAGCTAADRPPRGCGGAAAWQWLAANVPNQVHGNSNPKWSFVPRHTIRAAVRPSADGAVVEYVAPTGDACTYALSPTSSRDDTDISDGGGGPVRRLVLTGLAGVQAMRLTCGPRTAKANGTVRATLTFSPTAPGGARTFWLTLRPAATLGVDSVVIEHGPTPALGDSVVVACSLGVCAAPIPAAVNTPLHYRYTYRSTENTEIGTSGVQTAVPR